LISDEKTKIVDSPKLRASDGQKATLRIGGDIPIEMEGLQRGAGIGVSPALSTKFTFADIGLDVIVTPQIHSPETVTLHLTLTAYDIISHTSTKNLADIRLQTGDTIILGRTHRGGNGERTRERRVSRPTSGTDQRSDTGQHHNRAHPAHRARRDTLTEILSLEF